MPEPLFNARRRALHRNLAVLALLGGTTLPYALALVALSLVGDLERGLLGSGVAALTVVLSALVAWWLQDRLALLGNRRLRRELRRHLEATGEFVGFAPGLELRSWEGETDQDVGFLTVEGDTLVYVGDRLNWSLRREAVDSLHLQGVGGPQGAAQGPLRLAIYWHGPRDPGRVLALSSREGDTLTRTNRLTLDLVERLRAWVTSPVAPPAAYLVYGPPPTDSRGSVLLDRPAPGSCLSALSLAIISLSLIWCQAGDLVAEGHYNRAVLWAGLILMAGIVSTAHFLTFLQVHSGRGARPGPPPPG